MPLTKSQMIALLAVAKTNPQFAIEQAFRFGMVAGQSDNTHKAIKRAAEMLDMDAEVLKECHTIGGNWSGESEAKADYDERKRITKILRGMA